MKNTSSRRSFLYFLAAAPAGAAAALAAASKHYPIGLELYSVRHHLAKNELTGTLRQVRKMGYQCVEFFSPYYQWTPGYARQVRRNLDDFGLRCYSTHNDLTSFQPKGIGKAMELNHLLGTRYIVLASPPGPIATLDGWKRVAETLNQGNDTMMRNGFHAGYHNDDDEWKPIDGKRPIDVVADSTEKSVILELDTGNCLHSGGDPVAYIKKHPGRIRAMHVKDWSPHGGRHVLLGEGVAPLKQILAAAESVGGIQYYLIEQEGSRYPEMKTARLCLEAFHRLHG
jgi:sugar phosphate isomerase/epimerase